MLTKEELMRKVKSDPKLKLKDKIVEADHHLEDTRNNIKWEEFLTDKIEPLLTSMLKLNLLAKEKRAKPLTLDINEFYPMLALPDKYGINDYYHARLYKEKLTCQDFPDRQQFNYNFNAWFLRALAEQINKFRYSVRVHTEHPAHSDPILKLIIYLN